MRITNYELVKVVNNASGTCLAASYPRTGMQSPIESDCKIYTYIYLYSLDLMQREQRFLNVRAGYVLYRALVVSVTSFSSYVIIHVQ